MANNRMWLTNRRTGEKILLAKYYPSSGWYVKHDDLPDRLNELFKKSEPPPTDLGGNDWEIDYDVDMRSKSQEK